MNITTPDGDEAILRARARALARPPGHDAAQAGPKLHVLEFRLGGERYAIETAFVQEVHPLRNLTPLPSTPPHVLGVVSVRGQIHTVMDLRRILGLPVQGLADLHRVILLGRGDVEFGILADLSVGVLEIAQAQLHDVNLHRPSREGGCVRGATPDGLLMLDAKAILDDPRMTVDDDFGDDMRGNEA